MTAARVYPPELLARVAARAEALRQRDARLGFLEFLTSSRFCQLELSPVVEAIALASEGRPVAIDDATCAVVFNCRARDLPTQPRRTVAVRAGGRAGKTSRLLATKALHASWTVPLPDLRRGEVARALLVSPDKDLAAQCLAYVKGYIAASPTLRAAVVEARPSADEDDDIGTKERVVVRRPDGHLVEIVVKAATRGGKGARSRTLVFAGLDEAAFFFSDDDHAVTDKAIYQAAIQRVVPGGQIWIVSTPWIEDLGILEETVASDWGTHEDALVAVGGTRLLNPHWDPDGTIERDMRRRDPDNAAREIDAVPLSAGTKLFFPKEVVDPAIATDAAVDGPELLAPLIAVPHYAASDLGFRKNSSALAIVRREAKIRTAWLEELRPERGKPLRPSVVCSSFGATCHRYGARTMRGDLHYADTAREELSKIKGGPAYDEWNPSADAQSDAFTEVRRRLQEGLVEVPNHLRLLMQLKRTTSKPMAGGRVQINPGGPGQGAAHGDVLMAWVLAVVQVPAGAGAAIPAPRPRPDRWGGAGRGFG